MPSKTQGQAGPAWLLSEENGYRSRDHGSLKSGTAVTSGSLAAKRTSTGLWENYANAGSDGTGTVAGLFYDAYGAAAGTVTVPITIVTRDCEVNGAELDYHAPAGDLTAGQIAVANSHLLNDGIIVRTGR